jgi:riboflavin kinase/FMN adenylyltransferase
VSRRAFSAGVFDGVHVGHRRVLESLLGIDPDARVLVFPRPEENDVPLLTSVERRVELLREAGVRRVAVHENGEPLQPEPGEVLVTGPDLKVSYAPSLIVNVPLVEGVSSERVRQLVRARELAAAGRILTRPFDLEGVVVEGAKRGRDLGFPTANLAVAPELLVPPNGIYAGAALEHRAAISIGTNPHYGGSVRTVEAFILDFDGDLYGRPLRVELWEHLRDEAAFSSEQELVRQIARDVERARAATRPD